MRFLLLILIQMLFFTVISAQPEPCNPDHMTSTCMEACVVCDIDGFTGRNNLTEQGQTFSGFCTTIFHNMSYIAFVAGTEYLSLIVSVSNCTIGEGIEVGIFESLDCSTFSPVTDCNTDVPPNGSATFTNTVPLVVGQYYYLIMDGSKGDICDWTFNVIAGSTLVGELTGSGAIEGPDEICPGLATSYSTTGEVGATFYSWTLDGQVQNATGQNVDVTFPSDGTYELCVTASNVCDEAPPTCKTIYVASIEDTFLDETICANDCIEVAGEMVCETGNYTYTIPLPNGCDSMVFLDLVVLPELASFVDLQLCEGSSFSIGDTDFSTTGVFVETIPNALGCDSSVTLDLTMLDCELVGTVEHLNPICHGDENGTLIFTLENGILPITYAWKNILNTSISGSGSVDALTDVVIENIPAGTYEIYVQDGLGNDIVFIQEVYDPPVLDANLTSSDYNGQAISCFDGMDGIATATGFGGVAPYTYLWSNNATDATISNLSAGMYQVTITDESGCEVLGNVSLSEPQLMAFEANFTNPNCDGEETGVIQLESIAGGTAPYTFVLNAEGNSSSDIFDGLGSGVYTYSVVDANGCTADTSGSLYAPDIPILYMDDDQEIDLGGEVMIGAETNNTTLTDIAWMDDDQTLDCDDCLDTYASPVNDTEYILTVTSIDGCSTSESIWVRVNKVRNVYIPNIFTPNGDGINDFFFINANKSVASIKTLKIYNRWGELMYDQSDLLPNDELSGWNGYFKGEAVNSGVYAWMAEVEYLDGVVSLMKGDVTIMK